MRIPGYSEHGALLTDLHVQAYDLIPRVKSLPSPGGVRKCSRSTVSSDRAGTTANLSHTSAPDCLRGSHTQVLHDQCRHGPCCAPKLCVSLPTRQYSLTQDQRPKHRPLTGWPLALPLSLSPRWFRGLPFDSSKARLSESHVLPKPGTCGR